ncbi:MAG: hypothetical protein K8S23_02575 [Candidatus Cloacimonetes bacterium]|nr:hypothetical protein [Candidatus Cloacimonadota bacterium]
MRTNLNTLLIILTLLFSGASVLLMNEIYLENNSELTYELNQLHLKQQMINADLSTFHGFQKEQFAKLKILNKSIKQYEFALQKAN